LVDRDREYTAEPKDSGFNMQTSSQGIEGSGAQPSTVQPSQTKLTRASELARSGDTEAALVLLLQMDPTPAALDMRARIELQLGRYADAQALWREVLDQAPGHAGAKQGLVSVERAVLRGKLLRQFALAIVLLSAAGVGYLALRPKPEQPASAHVQQLPPRQLTAAKPAAAVHAPKPAAKVVAPAAPTLPQIALPEGVSMRREDGVQVYAFDGGLFSQGVAFVGGGRERVTALGRLLAPYTDTIKIELVGYIDTLPKPLETQYHDNTELALSRANAVLGRFARTTRIPADALGLRAVGGRLGPYSNEQGDPRNRTVEVRVSLRPEQ
jgi:flagellar motor protein MotB